MSWTGTAGSASDSAPGSTDAGSIAIFLVPTGSTAFIAAYEAALEGGSAPSRRAKAGTMGQLVRTYLESAAFANLADSTKAEKRLRLDWIDRRIGEARYARIRPRHVEALWPRRTAPMRRTV